MLVAGNHQAQAVVRVVAIDDDGQVHFIVLPGSVETKAAASGVRHRMSSGPVGWGTETNTVFTPKSASNR